MIESEEERSTQDASGASEVARVLMLGITSFTASLSFVLIPAIFRLRRQKVLLTIFTLTTYTFTNPLLPTMFANPLC